MSTQVNSRVAWISRDNLAEHLNLINSCFSVVSGRWYDFVGNVPPHLYISRKPYCREMPLSQLPYDNIAPVLECLADAHPMIATFAVIFRVLLFCCNLGAVVTGR